MRKRRSRGFTLIELLVVIGIIAVITGILMPVLGRVRQKSTATKCASNLRQIATAFQNYLNNSKGTMFWRGADVSLEGMDWYVCGGREKGNANLNQGGLFNRFVPRPLNPYVSNAIKVFHCPGDDATTTAWAPSNSCFDWVGNSYNFNATGNPNSPAHGVTSASAGLDGKRISRVRNSTNIVVFFDAALTYPGVWDGKQDNVVVGNIAFMDGHVEFLKRPGAEEKSLAWLD